MTDDSEGFIQEVHEGLRQDRAMSAIRRYWPMAAAAVVALLLGIVGYQVWQSQRIRAARVQSDAFAAALRQAGEGDLEGASVAFERLSNEGPSTYRTLARMEHAAILVAQGDLQAALSAYDEIAADTREQSMRESAQLRAAYIAADTQDFPAMQARLQPLIDEGGPISMLARELLAVEAWEAGDLDIARDNLENLRLALDAPESLRQRAERALAVIGPAPDPAAPAESAPTPSQGETE